MKKWMALCLVLAVMLTVTACGESENAVYVQKVSDLVQMGAIAPGDKFAGIVVSENITEIQKDQQMVVDELMVREGDDVTEGQTLFSYDTEQLQLSLDKQRLELEQLNATIDNYEDQIKELEKDAVKNKAYADKAGKNKTYTRDGKKSSKSYKKSAE